MNEEEEYESNVFGVFLRYIPNGQIDEAFAVIKDRELDVNERPYYYKSLLRYYVTDECGETFPDNPDVIERMFLVGYRISDYDPQVCVAYGIVYNHLRCVRYLLKRFPNWLDTYALQIYNDCWDWDLALIRLVDLGLNLDLIYGHQSIPRFLYDFTHLRNIARKGAIVVMGAMRGRRDVARIIARVVWESRALHINEEKGS